MCDAISVRRVDLPDALIERFGLNRTVRTRTEGAEQEIWFFASERWPRLPVWFEGELHLYPWGSKSKNSGLPTLGYLDEAELSAGTWQALHPQSVDVLATFALSGGFWYSVPRGIRGILVRSATGRPHVYLRTTSATVYFRNMTRCDREPVFIGEQI